VFAYADIATMRAALRVGLQRYEDPEFFALLQRCSNSVGQVSASIPRAVQIVESLTMIVGITLALSVLNPWIVAVAVCAAIPALITQLWSGRRWYRVEVENSWLARLRYYLANAVRGRSAAAEIRA
jgi:hypothetical protein